MVTGLRRTHLEIGAIAIVSGGLSVVEDTPIIRRSICGRKVKRGNEMDTIELHQAFVFTCEDCGRDTFVRAVEISPEAMEGTEMDDETRESLTDANEAAEACGINVGGTWLMAPDTVTCSHCGAEFATEDS
jgi:hypothetical protein